MSTTGLLAVLDTGRPGPHIALRCDIDALPVAEEPNNLVGPRVCVSDDPQYLPRMRSRRTHGSAAGGYESAGLGKRGAERFDLFLL